jgi:hypothetical protein
LRTISDFRTLHLEARKDVFVPVVRLAAETGLVRWGHVSTDGTTMQGHASRHNGSSPLKRRYFQSYQLLNQIVVCTLVATKHELFQYVTSTRGKMGHKAMRYGYMPQDVERLRADMEAWGTQAHQQDEADEAALGRRRGRCTPTDGPEPSRPSPATGGGAPRREGAEQLDGSRAA